MAKLNQVFLGDVIPENEYLLFDAEEKEMSIMNGSEVIQKVCERYDYVAWAAEVGEEDASMENFLVWYAEDENFEAENYLVIFEKP